MKIEKETKVVILQNGNAVLATQYVNGKKVNASIARCCRRMLLILPLVQNWLWNGCLIVWVLHRKLLSIGTSLFPVTYGYRRTVPTLMPFAGLRRASFDRSNRRSSDRVECIS